METIGTGGEFTTTVVFITTEQPSSAKTVTTYSVVVFGETAIILFVCPPPQTKVDPPVAVNIASSPAQIVPSSSMRPDKSVTVTEAFGVALISMVPVALIVPHPPVKGIL
jgi:hypothetical protein